MSQRDLAFYLNPVGPERRNIMRHLADAGVRYIGTDGIPWMPGRDDAQFALFREDCAEFGLEVCSMHSVMCILADARSEPSPNFIAQHKLELKRLGMIGGRTVVYHACFMRDVAPEDADSAIARVGWEAFTQRYARMLELVATEADRYGLAVVLENTWHSVHTQSVAAYMDIIQQVAEPNVGVIIDSGHANLCSRSVAAEIRLAAQALMDVHFHDNHGPRDGILFDQHLPPGLGTIDWQDACRALDEIGFAGPVVFEGVLGPGDSIATGRFGGALTHRDLIRITIDNWRAFELLAEQAAARKN